MPTLRRASRHQRPHHRHTLKLQSTTEAATKFHGQRVILRHTAVALMIAAGATDTEIQLTLGHSDIETSRRIYMHVLDSQQNTTADRVEEIRHQRALAMSLLN